MKPRFEAVLEMAVDEGAMQGVIKAFKGTETPIPAEVHECVVSCVLASLERWFDMGENDE